MGLGTIILLTLVMLVLVIGLFSMLTNPADIDAEEEASVVKEMNAKKKKHWWQR